MLTIIVSQVANPLGVVGVLSAFNFPVAVYGWYYIQHLIIFNFSNTSIQGT